MLLDDNSQGCFFLSPTINNHHDHCFEVSLSPLGGRRDLFLNPSTCLPCPLHWTLQGWIVMFVHKDIFGTVHAYFCLVLLAKLHIIRCLEIVGVCDAALLNAWLGSLARLGGGLPGWCAEHSVRLVCSAQSWAWEEQPGHLAFKSHQPSWADSYQPPPHRPRSRFPSAPPNSNWKAECVMKVKIESGNICRRKVRVLRVLKHMCPIPWSRLLVVEQNQPKRQEWFWQPQKSNESWTRAQRTFLSEASWWFIGSKCLLCPHQTSLFLHSLEAADIRTSNLKNNSTQVWIFSFGWNCKSLLCSLFHKVHLVGWLLSSSTFPKYRNTEYRYTVDQVYEFEILGDFVVLKSSVEWHSKHRKNCECCPVSQLIVR